MSSWHKEPFMWLFVALLAFAIITSSITLYFALSEPAVVVERTEKPALKKTSPWQTSP